MRLTILFFFTTYIIGLASAQQLDYLRFTMGPKVENYNVADHPNLVPLMHLDVSAGLYIGKYFTESFSAELGVVKNDYSAKYQFELNDPSLNREQVYFKNYLYPTMSTYQLAVSGAYRSYLANLIGLNNDPSKKMRTTVYFQGGINFFLNRKLSKEGSEVQEEAIIDENGNQISSFRMITCCNTKEAGNFLLRADIGINYALNNYLLLDISAQVKGATLPVSSFKVEYLDENQNQQIAEFSSKAFGIGLNLGIKIELNKD
ncbi:hypothetical protein GYB22_06295 [bacterium]|nr:hypothetical protein [bacterium]